MLTRTALHQTHISILTWLQVVFNLCAEPNGVSAEQVERRYDLSPNPARTMVDQIRAAMPRRSPADPEQVLHRLLQVERG